jgi:hypothetical protein
MVESGPSRLEVGYIIYLKTQPLKEKSVRKTRLVEERYTGTVEVHHLGRTMRTGRGMRVVTTIIVGGLVRSACNHRYHPMASMNETWSSVPGRMFVRTSKEGGGGEGLGSPHWVISLYRGPHEE